MITSVASTILITSCLITLGMQKEEYGAGTLRVQLYLPNSRREG